MDPDYKYFLDNLRPDGKSYVLETASVYVKYEEDEEEREKIKEMGLVELKDFDGPVDDDYRVFLENLRVRDGSMMLELKHNEPIEYERGEFLQLAVVEGSNRQGSRGGSSSLSRDSLIGLPMLPKPYGNGVQLSFESRLKEKLEKPYSQKEYEELMELARLRKPVVHFKRMRKRDVPYETDQMGLSYFDHHPDLAMKVFDATDRRKGLELLRGFFFWLKNLDHEGAYKPWAPPSSR